MRECCSSGTDGRHSWRSDARTNTIFGMKSRVHPKYKTKSHVGNWPEYEISLVRRGDIALWLSTDAIVAWTTPAPSGRRGGQRKFSGHAIETALTLRLVFGLPLRQAEGFLRWVLFLMHVDLEAPDHTTLSRLGVVSTSMSGSTWFRPTNRSMPLAKELTDCAFVDSPVNQALIEDLATGALLRQQRNAVLLGAPGRGRPIWRSASPGLASARAPRRVSSTSSTS